MLILKGLISFDSFVGLEPLPKYVLGKVGFSGIEGSLSFHRAQKRPDEAKKNTKIRYKKVFMALISITNSPGNSLFYDTSSW